MCERLMYRMGSYKLISVQSTTSQIDTDDLDDMFSSIWNEPPDFAEEEKKSDPNGEPDSCFPNHIVKQYTIVQHNIPEDVKNKLKNLGIKIKKDAYGRYKVEADEFTIGIAEGLYKLTFKEEVPKP